MGRICLAFAGLLSTLLCLTPRSSDAQLLTRPQQDWRTIETKHFQVHFPAAMEDWALPVTARLESVHEGVAAMVGSAPTRKVTVVIDDPLNISNAFALPSLDFPAIFLWPTPPKAAFDLGEHRGWGELLAVHEFAHLAHLTRPSRNPRQRLLWRIMPENLSPIARRSPRWITEGYATYLEGQLTGSGRPHGVFRPAILRQLAIEGRLPSYGELNGSGEFLGGAMAYLAGSAFIEWLVERQGEESLRNLWLRMTARADRGFADAFAGVYGGMPEDLYRRFTVELTVQAVAIEESLRAAGLVTGDTVQRRSWFTGAPTLSPDGEHIALVVGSREQPSRVVVWTTEEEEETEEQQQRRERMRERDPLDVPAIEWRPRARRAVAELHHFAGRAHSDPRFMPDGQRILVHRSEPLPDGSVRPDLFEWNYRSGSLRRVTRGAALHDTDPAPDGKRAVATQCIHGSCGVVMVDIATGDMTPLLRGSPDRVYYRPRFSPDGEWIAVSVHERGRWRVILASTTTGATRELPIDDQSHRYHPVFQPGGEALVVVSERGGIPNLELVRLADLTVRPVTRVTGIATAPEPHPTDGSIFYLSFHARGLDLMRIHPDSVRANGVAALPTGMGAAAPISPAAPVDTFLAREVPPSRPYGLGPRQWRWMPLGGGSWSAGSMGLMVMSTDPVGRLAWVAQGLVGHPAAWRGASLSAEYRAWTPRLGADLHHVVHLPHSDRRGVIGSSALDMRLTGAIASVRLARAAGPFAGNHRLSAAIGRLELAREGPEMGRSLVYADLRRDFRGGRETTLEARIWLHGALGTTAGDEWNRGVARLALSAYSRNDGIEVSGVYGEVSSGAPLFERFVVGDLPTPLTDNALLSQRLPFGALPFAAVGGRRAALLRATLLSEAFSPYYALVAGGERFDRWHRVIGVEDDATIDAIPIARLPSMRIVGGIGYSLDEPARRKWRGYTTFILRP